jgi:RNA polymerase sigma-70 factor (ECF subfamily)
MPASPQPRLEAAMDRFAAGDDTALAEVYDLGSPAVFTFLMGLSRERQLAEDLTQETFLRIHRARGLFRAGSPVLPWAYTIARRLFLDHVRARRAEKIVSPDGRGEEGGEGRDGVTDAAASAPSAEELFADRELSAALENALGRLPEAQATAFRLLKGEGLSVAEVAGILGTTKGAVKLRAHRAYEALRGLLRGPLAARSDGSPDGAGNARPALASRDRAGDERGS